MLNRSRRSDRWGLVTGKSFLTGILIFELVFPAPLLAASGTAGKSRQNKSLTVDELIGRPALNTGTKTTEKLATAQALTMSSSSVPSSGAPSPQSWAGSFQPELFGGGGAMAIPLFSLPGRGKITFPLVLSYSPRRGNGIFGFGWGIDFGLIERSTKDGVPKYDDTDNFRAMINGQGIELVKVASGEYRAKVEGAFQRFFYRDGFWEVKGRDGTTYFFGMEDLLNDSSRERNGDKIFNWRLSEVKDVYGNYCFIRYLDDGGFEIRYPGEPGTDREPYGSAAQNMPVMIKTEMEAATRPDVELSYRSGFEHVEKRRVKLIAIYAEGKFQHRYDFEYQTSLQTGRSLLTGIKEYGDDGNTRLPKVSFVYSAPDSLNYQVSSIQGDPTIGDKLFNVRRNGKDYFHSNEYILYPHYGSDPDRGVFSCGLVIDWNAKITKKTYSDSWGNWSHGSGGDFHYRGKKDSAMYGWTYLYLKQPKTITLKSSGDIYHMFLNGNYSSPFRGGSVSLKSGYNLLEVTGYNQNNVNPVDISTALGNQVDLMNSSQVIVPQLAGDFNGDGLSDIATFFESTGTVKVALSNGQNFLPKTTWLDNFGKGGTPLITDFNADGYADIGVFVPERGEWSVAYSDGSRFISPSKRLTGFGVKAKPTSGDFNGDGYADFGAFQIENGKMRLRLALCRPEGCKVESKVFTVGPENGTPMSGDFNGDGLTDIGVFVADSGNWYMRLNPGDLSMDFPEMTVVSSFGMQKTAVTADFNFDGRTDIGFYDAGQGKIVFRPAQNKGFLEQQTMGIKFSLKDNDVQAQNADFNGDGLNDYAVYNNLGNVEIALSNGTIMDLMVTTKNGVGGETRIDYRPSTSAINRFLPFVIPLVSSVTLSDGRGNDYRTEYEYSGGYFNASQKEFYGFEKVRVIDGLGHYQDMRFLQDNEFVKGCLAEQSQFDRSGRLYSRAVQQWDSAELSPGRRWVYLKRKDHIDCDDDGFARRTAEEYFYDETPQLGNMTRMIQWGEVDIVTGNDIAQDRRSVELDYVSNTDSDRWIIGLPREYRARDASGKIMRKTQYFYDGNTRIDDVPQRGLLTTSKYWTSLADDSSNPVQRFEYDLWGNLARSIDPEGNAVQFEYDSKYHSFLLRTRNPLGHEVKNEYYGIAGVPRQQDGWHGLWGQAKAVTDANGQVSQNVYDVLGRLIAVVGPLDSLAFPTVQYEYTSSTRGWQTRSKRRIEHEQAQTLDQVNFYDSLNRLWAVKRASGQEGQWIVSGQVNYDGRGQVIAAYRPRFVQTDLAQRDEIDLSQPVIQYEYDALGRTSKVIQEDGSFTDNFYRVWVVQHTDMNGHQTFRLFDAYGRIHMYAECDGADGRSSFYPYKSHESCSSTAYSYDSEGALLAVSDPMRNKISVTYDLLGRKTVLDDPDMGRSRFGYDLNSNLAWAQDAKGQTFNYFYDGLNRQTERRGPEGILTQYAYDDPGTPFSNGRLTATRFGDGLLEQKRFGYDQLGREREIAQRIGGIDYSVQSRDNALGQTTELVYPDGQKVRYEYDAAGQLKAVWFNDISVVREVEYEASGRPIKIVFGSGGIRFYEYDSLTQRLNRIRVVSAGGSFLQDLEYFYDSLGQVIGIEDGVGRTQQQFSYDAQDRLVQALGPQGPEVFSYDTIGNRVSDSNGQAYYGLNGRLPHAIIGHDDGSAMSYDANGNMVGMTREGETNEFIYDSENRLRKFVKNSSQDVRFDYDSEGLRYRKETVLPNEQTTLFLGELEERGPQGIINYIYLGNERIAAVVNGELYYLLSDPLGSVRVITDKQGQLFAKNEFSVFGERLAASSPATLGWQSRLFSGQIFDQESGLYYYGARYYLPRYGRFLSPDGYLPGGMEFPRNLNRYTYANNSPIMYRDPDGNFPWLAFAIGALIGGASAGIAAYQVSGDISFSKIALGALTGGLSGATLGMSSAAMKELGWGSWLLKGAAGASLASQVSSAAGWADGAQGLQYASMGMAGLYTGVHVGLGGRDWLHESRFKTTDLKHNVVAPQSGDKIYVNGILTPYDRAVDQAAKAGANLLAYNPTTSAIADLTESLLGRITFTSSVSRQLANSLVGLEGITLTGYSQGAIIIGNTMLDLGLSNHRSVVAKAIFQASPLSQPEAYLSAAIAGVSGNNVIYSNKVFDVINVTGPNLNPMKTAGGILGGGLFFGLNQHASY